MTQMQLKVSSSLKLQNIDTCPKMNEQIKLIISIQHLCLSIFTNQHLSFIMASCSKYWLLCMLMYPQVLGNGNSQHLSSSEIVCSQNDDHTATGLLHPNMSAYHQQEHCCFLILVCLLILLEILVMKQVCQLVVN